MTNKNIYRSLGGLDPELIMRAAPAEKVQKEKKSAWVKWASMAACFVLIASAILVVPMLQDTALYSADEIAALLYEDVDGVATNAYTKIYVPNSEYLYINDIPEDTYLNIYRYENPNPEISEAGLQSFIDGILPQLAEALDVSVPQYSIKENSRGSKSYHHASLDFNRYFMNFSNNSGRYRIRLIGFGEDNAITIEGETIQIDQRLSDEEILVSLQSIKNKLFRLFNVTFSDAKIIRTFGSGSEYGAEHIYIYFYDEDAHPLNALRQKPLSDYICIDFDNFKNSSTDVVSAGVLKDSGIEYVQSQIDISEKYIVAESAKKISLSEAEALLYNGYVFGGHSCPLCMLAQDKVSFEDYDFVDIEYVFGYDDKTGDATEGIPFYAFYKNIGMSKNGNLIYAKTYVPAIEVSGYEEYFESQKENHDSNGWS